MDTCCSRVGSVIAATAFWYQPTSAVPGTAAAAVIAVIGLGG